MSERPHIEHWFSAEDEVCLTQEQMLNYAQGKLVATEKNTVERHLLNCDLCAFAYEGLAGVEDAEVAAAVSSITDEAWGRVEALSKSNRKSAYFWMSSAAAILLLIVVGFFAVDRQNKQELKELASGMFELPDVEQAEVAAEDKSPLLAEGKQQKTLPMDAPPPAPKMEAPKMEVPVEEKLDSEEAELMGKVSAPEEIVDFDGLADADDGDFDDFVSIQEESADELSMEPAPEEDGNFGFATSDDEAYQPKDLGLTQSVTTAAKPDAYNKDFEGIDLLYQADSVATNNGSGSYMGGVEVADAKSVEDAPVEMAEEEVISSEFKDVLANQSVNRARSANEPLISKNAPVATSSRPGRLKRRDERAQSNSEPKAKKETRSGSNSREDQLEKSKDKGSNSLFEQGMKAYEKSDFEEGARLLRQASITTPSNLYAHFYAGICYLQLEQASAAIFHLDRVLEQPNNSLEEDAQWYKSIALLQQGEKRKAKTILEEIDQGGRSRARDARKALEKLDQP